MKMHKILLHVLFFYIAFAAMVSGVFAQSSITSPYSRFGIGELAPQYNLRSSAMGGISQGIVGSAGINFANPASYAAFDSLSFLFDAAMTGSFNTLRSDVEKDRSSTAAINYITMGMPVAKRCRIAFGLIPISSIGYNIYNIIEKEDLPKGGESTGRQFNFFTGEGSFDKAFLGASFKVSKGVAIGLNVGYMFGNSNYVRTISFDTLAVRTTKITNKVYVNGLTLEPSIQYYLPLSNKDRMTFGATYNVQNSIKAENDFLVRSMIGGDGNNQGSYPDTIDRDIVKGNLKLPASFKIGFSYARPDKFLMGADFYWTNWSQYSMLGQEHNLSNTWGVSIGGEFTPNNKLSAKYFQRTVYRAGFKTQQSLFEFEGEKVNLYAFSFGMGLPLPRSKTMINLYFEGGTKGKTTPPLIQDNYFKIGAGLSLHEMWFYKRQYK
ncbi:MAG: outer membrane protein transport protein [Bacteroidales bacterium]|nr:outer membrane protein transport protein [Bacteroidales bacterium]